MLNIVEDVIKDKIEPYPSKISPYRSYEIQEIQSISRHVSPVATGENADEIAVPINTSPRLTLLPRLPTPPEPIISPTEKIETPPKQPSSPTAQELFPFPQESAFVVDFEKIRRGN